MVRLMVGRDDRTAGSFARPGRTRRKLLARRAPRRRAIRIVPAGAASRDVSLSLRRGEILGLAGLIGAGRTDLLLALTGALDRRSPGRDPARRRATTRRRRPAGAREGRARAAPEERKAQAIFPGPRPSRRTSSSLARARVSRAGLDRPDARGRDRPRALMRDTGVRAASPSRPDRHALAAATSRRPLLARCLFASPTVLLLDEPTRGIDLAAKAEIYALLRRLAAEGFGIVLCSSEMSEILTQCHRVARLPRRAGHGRADARRSDRGADPRGGRRNGSAAPPGFRGAAVRRGLPFRHRARLRSRRPRGAGSRGSPGSSVSPRCSSSRSSSRRSAAAVPFSSTSAT